jgi:hypothetical protein
MGKIASPATDNHPGRFLALQDAMADDVSNICLSAIEAGWNRRRLSPLWSNLPTT